MYKGFWNSLSTFCYLAAQWDLFGQLVYSRLASEIRLLDGRPHSTDDYDHRHAGDEEHADAVDGDLYVVRRVFRLCDVHLGCGGVRIRANTKKEQLWDQIK